MQDSLILMVEHALGGGIQRHVKELITLFSARAQFMILRPVPGGLLRISHDFPEIPPRLYFDAGRELSSLRRFLKSCRISRIHYHQTIQMPWDIARLHHDLAIPYDYTAHDYFSFCPQITLTSEKFRYCGEPNEAGCNACLSIRPTPERESIEDWRLRHGEFVLGAARVFVPSQSVGERLKKYFPAANLVLAPHPEPVNVVAPPRWPHSGERPLKVLVLGALNPTKGPDLLEASATDAHTRMLPLEFHLLGSAYRSLKARPDSALCVHGPYRDEDLDRLTRDLAPDIVWFPAQWPETYSYTLSAAIRLGLAVVAPDFGAFRDRLATRPLSWLFPWDIEAAACNDLFVRLRKDPSTTFNSRLPPSEFAPVFSYDSDYLLRDDRPRLNSPKLDLDVGIHRRSWRFSKEFICGSLMFSGQRILRKIYTVAAVRRIATWIVPEYRLQLLRRWLGRY